MDSEVVTMIDFTENGKKTINEQFLRIKTRERISQVEMQRKLEDKCTLLEDNAPIHTAQVTVAEAIDCGFELLSRSRYSRDLVPSDFFLLSKLKSYRLSHHFGNNNDVICAVEEILENQDITFFCDGIEIFEHDWTKCIYVKGDYTEEKKQSGFSDPFWVRL